MNFPWAYGWFLADCDLVVFVVGVFYSIATAAKKNYKKIDRPVRVPMFTSPFIYIRDFIDIFCVIQRWSWWLGDVVEQNGAV